MGRRFGSAVGVVLAALVYLALGPAKQLSYNAEAPSLPDVIAGGREPKPRGWVLRRVLLLADFSGSVAALAITQALFVRSSMRDATLDTVFVFGLGFWVVLAQGYGLYESDEVRVARSTVDDLPGIALLSSLATWVGILFLNATGLAHPRILAAGFFWLTSIGLIALGRASARALVRHRRVYERTVIVGAGRVGAEIAHKLARRPDYGLEVIGFVDDDPLMAPEDGPPHLGGAAQIEAILGAFDVRRVIFAFTRQNSHEQVDLFRRCLEHGVKVDIVPRMFEVIGSRMQMHELDGLPLVGLRAPRLSRSSRLLKRAFDLLLASGLLILFAPFLLCAALLIKLGSPGSVFFRQERMGAGGRRFTILKLRTMHRDADGRKQEFDHLNKHREQGPRMFKIPNDPRVTRFGAFLRRWSLDELPQLINVLRGEMSLVGPRPLILEEDEHITGLSRSRLKLTPGITGLWQVLGRSDIPFAEMVALDYLYVTNWSLWGDVKLLARTVPVVFQKRGAY